MVLLSARYEYANRSKNGKALLLRTLAAAEVVVHFLLKGIAQTGGIVAFPRFFQ